MTSTSTSRSSRVVRSPAANASDAIHVGRTAGPSDLAQRKDHHMTRQAPRLAGLLLALVLPVAGWSAEPTPAEGAKGTTPSLELGCAVAKAVGAEAICRELAFFKHEDARAMGEQLAQLLDAPARSKALKLVDAELADKSRKGAPGKDCAPSRPLCPFPTSALTALKEGLGPDGK